MGRDIQIGVERDFIRVTYRGDVEYQATTDMLRKLAELSARTGIERVVFDLRAARYSDYQASTVRHAEEGASLGARRSWRIVFLGDPAHSILPYIEAVAVNRDWCVKAFTDEAAALAWLHEDD